MKKIPHFYVNALMMFMCFQSIHAQPEEEIPNDLESPNVVQGAALQGLCTFAIVPQYSLSSELLREKVNETISKELGKIGKVVKLKVPDIVGFGNSGAFLILDLTHIDTWNDKSLPIVQSTLSLQIPMVSQKTGKSCMVPAWATKTFFEGQIEEKNRDNILMSVRTITRKFIEDYRLSNRENEKKPIFYLYIP